MHQGGIRTPDLLIKKQVTYHFHYTAIIPCGMTIIPYRDTIPIEKHKRESVAFQPHSVQVTQAANNQYVTPSHTLL